MAWKSRLAIYQNSSQKSKKANEAFSNALKAEKDKKSFHSALVLFWWGYFLRDSQQSLAIKKLNEASQIARTLPVEKRGTVLSDAIMVQSYIEGHNGRKREQQSLIQQSTVEIELQKKLKSKLGPDFYHRL